MHTYVEKNPYYHKTYLIRIITLISNLFLILLYYISYRAP